MSHLKIEPSKIHGVGIFTKDPIPKGTKMFLAADLNEFEKGGDIMTRFGGLVNHTKTPNCEFKEDGNSGLVYLHSLRNIYKNEELTIDYSVLPFPFKSDITGYKNDLLTI